MHWISKLNLLYLPIHEASPVMSLDLVSLMNETNELSLPDFLRKLTVFSDGAGCSGTIHTS